MSDLFQYNMPYKSELEQEYIAPYRFNKELTDFINYMFLHPVHNNKFHKLYSNLHRDTDANDMLKVPYRMYLYYLDHPNRFGGEINNIIPMMIVKMWKTFLSLHKLRGETFSQYYKTSMKLVPMFENKFIDLLDEAIQNKAFIGTGDEMIKERPNVGLRERVLGYSDKQLDYLCSLD